MPLRLPTTYDIAEARAGLWIELAEVLEYFNDDLELPLDRGSTKRLGEVSMFF